MYNIKIRYEIPKIRYEILELDLYKEKKMKKRIIAIILVLCLTLSVFSGCTLIEKDESKVLAQAVVTIGSGETAQEITMTDIISSYNSVGYIYIYYFGMTYDEVLSMVIENLITQSVFVYAALQELPVLNSSDNIYERYLTAEEIAEVNAQVDQLIADEIDATEVTTLQTVFTADGATLTTIDDRSVPDWANVSTTVPASFQGTASRESAYASFVSDLSTGGYTFDEMYDLMYETYLEAKISEKYQEVVLAEYSVSVSDIITKYNAQLADEIEYYSVYGLEDYMTKYDTDYNSVIYNPTGEEYGYVKQILVSFTDEELASLEGLEGDELTAAKLALAEGTVATDMRDSWLHTYGYNTSTDGLFSSYDFDGTVSAETVDGVQIRDEEGNFAYSNITANEYTGYEEFLSDVVNPYLGGSLVGYENGFAVYDSTFDNDKLDDLIYAYNEDPGAFGVDYGYFVPDDSFYDEFNTAAQTLLDYGVGSYTIAVTDYGYHIVYLTKIVSAETYSVFVESEMNTVGTFSYEFSTAYQETAKTAYFDERTTEICDEYDTDENVVINESAYAEMVELFNAS